MSETNTTIESFDFLDDKDLMSRLWKSKNNKRKKIFKDHEVILRAKFNWQQDSDLLKKVEFKLKNRTSVYYDIFHITYENSINTPINYILLHVTKSGTSETSKKSFSFQNQQLSLKKGDAFGVLFQIHPNEPTSMTNINHGLEPLTPESKDGSIIIGI